MIRRRREDARAPRRRKVSVDLIPHTDSNGQITEPYEILEEILNEHHPRLFEVEAKVVLLWRRGWKPDRDNRLTMGKAKRASDLDMALANYDFAIQINAEAWSSFDSDQKRHLIDHELCHCELVADAAEEGGWARNEHGRLVTRIRGHDLEEFREVVDRHGYHVHAALEAFAMTVLSSQKSTLFDSVN